MARLVSDLGPRHQGSARFVKLALRAAKPGAEVGVRILVGRQSGLGEAVLGLLDHIVLDGEALPEPRSAQGQTEIRARPFD